MLEEIDSQGIDECRTEKLQEIPIKVANEQELEECMQEEVVSNMTLPEIYRDVQYIQMYSYKYL